jgi:Na+/H+ antiporter NhaD/arsenite permease-like protein
MEVTVGIFVLVYLGMMLGRYPGLALDRTGFALLGALALIGTGVIGTDEAWNTIDVPTMGLLFGLMVVSAQFRLGGFYTATALRLSSAPLSPPLLLGVLVLVTGLLSALLSNDIVCLAMAPVLADGCARRGLDPKPYLLALACAANVGSAATLIGNPQNMLIGQALGLSFGRYLADALVPALAGLACTWGIFCLMFRGRWHADTPPVGVEQVPFNAWQTAKAATVLVAVVGLFLFSPFPREAVALCGAGVLLLSRRMHTRTILELVDWHLLVLFIGLFIVNGALQSSGALEAGMAFFREAGIPLAHPAWLFVNTAVLSNLVSNVPATMLLLPVATHPMAGAVLALASTLAGNFIIVGSIANIIVVEQASRMGIRIGVLEHAKTGIPVTLATLAVAALWLWARSLAAL